MAKKRGSSKSVKAGKSVLNAIRRAKAGCTGKVFRALHVSEGLLMGAIYPGTYRKAGRKSAKKR